MTAQTVKTAISLDRELFARSDALAKELQVTRSGLVKQALEEFIAKRRNRRLLAQLNEVYSNDPEPPRHPALKAAHRRQIKGTW